MGGRWAIEGRWDYGTMGLGDDPSLRPSAYLIANQGNKWIRRLAASLDLCGLAGCWMSGWQTGCRERRDAGKRRAETGLDGVRERGLAHGGNYDGIRELAIEMRVGLAFLPRQRNPFPARFSTSPAELAGRQAGTVGH